MSRVLVRDGALRGTGTFGTNAGITLLSSRGSRRAILTGYLLHVRGRVAASAILAADFLTALRSDVGNVILVRGLTFLGRLLFAVTVVSVRVGLPILLR